MIIVIIRITVVQTVKILFLTSKNPTLFHRDVLQYRKSAMKQHPYKMIEPKSHAFTLSKVLAVQSKFAVT